MPTLSTDTSNTITPTMIRIWVGGLIGCLSVLIFCVIGNEVQTSTPAFIGA